MECKPLLIHKGTLWVGTESHGIHLFDLKTKQLIGHYTATSQTGRIPGNRVNCALQDSNGYIWIGFNGGPGGICRFNEQNESFTTFYPSNSSHKVRDVYLSMKLPIMSYGLVLVIMVCSAIISQRMFSHLFLLWVEKTCLSVTFIKTRKIVFG